MIIGLAGKIGCGKSTVADFLEREHGFHRHRMAGPLKDMMRCLGLTERHIEGDLKEVPCDLLGGKTPRFAMQTIGTDWGRDIVCQDIWTNAWRTTLPAGDVVCEDVRFPNEAETVRMAGGVVIRICRGDDKDVKHVSELQSFDTDYVLQNDGSVEDICRKVWNLALLLLDPDRSETFGSHTAHSQGKG